jgi:uncharacterized membrane protein (DUF4010 family)
MNWIAFFVVLLGLPLAGAILGTVQIAVLHLIIRWFKTPEEQREAVRGLFALGLLIGFATLVGMTWK